MWSALLLGDEDQLAVNLDARNLDDLAPLSDFAGDAPQTP
jgi:hypothetical protein